MSSDYLKIISFIHERRGFDCSMYSPSIVEKRIINRIQNSRCKTADEYYDLLSLAHDEIDILIDELTVKVSRFFRNTYTFEYLSEIIIPELIISKVSRNDPALRIWSAGCATGEEPYSIAMLLNEILKKEKLSFEIEIFATDINEKALEKAVTGVYSYENLKEIKYSYVKEYFTKKDNRYTIHQHIKKMVNFSCYDLLTSKTFAPPDSVYGHFDLIFCRNVLIYFQIRHREIIFRKLLRSLVKDGVIVLGNAEIPPKNLMDCIIEKNSHCRIYMKSNQMNDGRMN